MSASCSLTKKSLYIRNRSDIAITLIVPAAEENGFFNDSNRIVYLSANGKNKKQIIYYDKNKWTNTDRERLSNLLIESKLVMGKDTIVANNNFELKRIGLANELVLKIVKVN